MFTEIKIFIYLFTSVTFQNLINIAKYIYMVALENKTHTHIHTGVAPFVGLLWPAKCKSRFLPAEENAANFTIIVIYTFTSLGRWAMQKNSIKRTATT